MEQCFKSSQNSAPMQKWMGNLKSFLLVDVPFCTAPIPKNKVQGIIKPFKVVEVVSAIQSPSLSSLAQHRTSRLHYS